MGNQHHGYMIWTQPSGFSNVSSMDFDGTDDKVTIKNESNFDFVTTNVDDAFSLSMWLFPTDLRSGDPLIIKGNSDANSSARGWDFGVTSPGNLYLQLYDGASTGQYLIKYSALNMNIFADAWVHVAVTYDASATAGGINFYIDGVVSEFNYDSTVGGYSYLNDNSTSVRIGEKDNVSANYTGNIDEVSIWDKELSAAEVSEIFNSGTPADLGDHSGTANLLCWFRMGEDDATGADGVVDNSANSNHGTMEGSMDSGDIEATFPSSISYTWADTLSMDFDGSDEFISVSANQADFHFNSTPGAGGDDSPFSISIWAKMDDASDFRMISVGSDTSRSWTFGFRGDDRLEVWFNSEATSTDYIREIADSASTADEGAWHQYAMTYDGSETAAGITLYRDGSSIASSESSGGSYSGLRQVTALNIGRWNGVANANGKMNEASIWNKELSAAEVDEIYNSGAPADLGDHSAKANLLAWYRLGEGDAVGSNQITDWAAGGLGTHFGTATNMEAGDIQSDVP